MDKAQKAAHARALFDDPVFHEIMDDLEAAAINTAVYADITDNEKRAAALGEVRAIRALRANLESLTREDNRPIKGGIA